MPRHTFPKGAANPKWKGGPGPGRQATALKAKKEAKKKAPKRKRRKPKTERLNPEPTEAKIINFRKPSDYHKLLYEEFFAQGWTVNELAREANVSPGTISKHMSGVTKWPFTRTLTHILNALGFEVVFAKRPKKKRKLRIFME
jgi:ribosome-binding protein aMBF1 (putative translation factor)